MSFEDIKTFVIVLFAICGVITSLHTMNVLINRSNTSAWKDWKLKIVIEYTKIGE